MRDLRGVPLNVETIRLAFDVRCIRKVAMKGVFEVRNPQWARQRTFRWGSA
jgi:hypothetical protein